MIEALVSAANILKIDALLLVALCSTETDFRNIYNPDDFGSPSYGLCQIKLSTARMFLKKATPKKLMVPEYNALAAAHYVRHLSKRYPHSTECVISAYKAGRCKLYVTKKVVRKFWKRYISYHRAGLAGAGFYPRECFKNIQKYYRLEGPALAYGRNLFPSPLQLSPVQKYCNQLYRKHREGLLQI